MAGLFVQDTFKEHVGVMRALHAQYQTKDDAELVQQIQGLLQSAVNASSGREKEVRRIIQGGWDRRCAAAWHCRARTDSWAPASLVRCPSGSRPPRSLPRRAVQQRVD